MNHSRCLLLTLASIVTLTSPDAWAAPTFFADPALSQPGLVGSYLNRSLKHLVATNDWRVTQQIAGTRTDTTLSFTNTNWGARSPLGLTGGTSDTNWGNFSVQWDGYLQITQDGDRLATVSGEGSRMWIDLNNDGVFTPDELFNNHWGIFSWGRVGEWSPPLPIGTYRVRLQYYYESGDNEFRVSSPAFLPRKFVPSPGNPVQTVKVVVLNFAPRIPTEGGRKLWEVFGWGDPRISAKQFANDLAFSTGGAIDIQITDWRELEEFPLFTDGTRYTPEEYVSNRRSSSPIWKSLAADFYYYAERENLAELVNAGQVDEIWCFGDHFFSLWGEAWMAGPGSFFVNGPTFPKVGFNRAIAGYGFNYERGVGEMLHNLCHRTENHGQRAFGGWNLANPVSAFDKFSANFLNSPGQLAGVGTCHVPANGSSGYDYGNTQIVASTALDWPNYPNLSGATTTVGRETWGTQPYPDYQRDYLKFYFGMMPRNAATDAAGRQANWFKYIWDFNSYEPGTGRPREEDAFGAAATIRSPGGTSHDLTIRYYDGTGVDVASLGHADIFVTGPNGFSQAASLVSIGPEVRTTVGTARTVTYHIGAPGGTWDTSDAGTYSISLRSNQVRDTLGNPFPGGVVGQFYVELTTPTGIDTTPPTVTGSTTNAFRLNQSSHFLSVIYTDASGTDITSLDNRNILVSGPNGYSATAIFHSVTNSQGGTTSVANYWIYPPGGLWKASDNGVYTFSLQPGQVRDTHGNYANGQVLGTFNVNVPPTVRHPGFDLAETNAVDWLGWAASATATTTDDFSNTLLGTSSVRFSTTGGGDTWIRFAPPFGADWDISLATNLYFSIFARNTNSGQFQSNSPWVRLYDVSGDYFEYHYYQSGARSNPLNQALNRWQGFAVPLRPPANVVNGWGGEAFGSPRLNHIASLEVHADTWGNGFDLWYDGVYFDVPSPPLIVFQPTNQTVIAGTTVTLAIGTVGSTPFSYQWAKDGTIVAAGTNAVLALTNVSLADAGRYSVAVTNTAGSATSAVVTLSVLGPPMITTQPQGQSIFHGSNTLFQVIADGLLLQYQWRHEGTNLAGATNGTMTLTNVVRSSAGQYSVVVSNIAGAVVSSNALLIVTVRQRIGVPFRLGDGELRIAFGFEDNTGATASDLSRLQVQATTNFVEWLALPNALVLSNGLIHLEDASAPGHPQRFYRIIER
jgi:hypothetical protein